MFKKSLTLLLLAHFLAPLLAGAQTGQVYQEPKTGMLFPATLGSLTRVQVITYPQAQLGVCVRYQGKDLVKADIFIYDLGKQNLGSGLDSPEMRPHFEQVQQDIYQMEKAGRYQGVTRVSEARTRLSTPNGKLPVFMATFTYSQIPRPNEAEYEGIRISHLLLTAYDNYFVKMRFTYPQAQQSQGETAFRQFVAEFGKLLK